MIHLRPKKKQLGNSHLLVGMLISEGGEWDENCWSITHFVHKFLAQNLKGHSKTDAPSVFQRNHTWAEAERNTAQLELKRKTNYDVVCSSVLVGCTAQCISREKPTLPILVGVGKHF